MNQLSFYKYTTWGLLVLNLAMIAFFFLTKPEFPQQRRPPGDHQKMNASTTLGLNKDQTEKFLTSAKRHEGEIKSIDAQQKELLTQYFNSLIDTTLMSKNQITIDSFTTLEKQKIEITYRHFQEIKDILSFEQVNDFEPFMKEVLKKAIPRHRKNPPPPKDF